MNMTPYHASFWFIPLSHIHLQNLQMNLNVNKLGDIIFSSVNRILLALSFIIKISLMIIFLAHIHLQIIHVIKYLCIVHANFAQYINNLSQYLCIWIMDTCLQNHQKQKFHYLMSIMQFKTIKAHTTLFMKTLVVLLYSYGKSHCQENSICLVLCRMK